MERESRYFVSAAFWHWCHENDVSLRELGRLSGYSGTFLGSVRSHGHYTVSQRFVDAVLRELLLPEGMLFFRPAGYRWRLRLAA